MRRHTPTLRSLRAVAPLLHERVVDASYDSLATALIYLHQPYEVSETEWPVCQGCDRDDREAGDAVWPCRSYTMIATTLLHISDLESYLNDLRRELRQREEPTGRRLR